MSLSPISRSTRIRSHDAGGAGIVGSHLRVRLIAAGRGVSFPLKVEVDQTSIPAFPASPMHSLFDPVHTTKANGHGAINTLGSAKRAEARIMQACTSEVCGEPATVRPRTDSFARPVTPIGPMGCHDEGQRCAEALFFGRLLAVPA